VYVLVWLSYSHVIETTSVLQYIEYSKLWTILSCGYPLVPWCPNKRGSTIFKITGSHLWPQLTWMREVHLYLLSIHSYTVCC